MIFMPNPVVMSKNVANKLANLTVFEQETNGFILYLTLKGTDFVSSAYMGGVGGSGHVGASEESRSIVEGVQNKLGNSGYIEFHTHSRGTIAQFGRHYATNFSSGDLESIKASSHADPNYRHLLVTPERMMLARYDADARNLAGIPFSVRNFPGMESQEAAFQEVVKGVKQRLGIAGTNLPVTRRKH